MATQGWGGPTPASALFRMQLYWLILGILGVWQITHLLHEEDGPGGILAKARALLRTTFMKKAVSCFYCLTMWVALPVAAGIGVSWGEKGLLWFGLAGGASLLERATRKEKAPAPVYYEDAPAPTGEDPDKNEVGGDRNV